MKILRFLFIFLFILGLAWLMISILGPKEYKVKRSMIVNANDSIAHAYISNFSKWKVWSPWAEMDPSAKYNITGQDGMAGAVQSWDGEKTGKGSMTLTEVEPSLVKYDLAMVEPFESESMGFFELENAGENKTKVTWTDMGDIPFLQRAIFTFMSMEKMMGPQFERGLFKIDSVASYDQNTILLKQSTSL